MTAPATRRPRWRQWLFLGNRALRRVTRLEDTPYRIAMGCACGLFTAPLPMLGQMLAGMGLARLFRASVVAAMPWTWITNPFTSLPIWYGCYLVGAAVLRRDPVGFAEIQRLFSEIDTIGLVATIRRGGALLAETLAPLWLGTALIGLLLAAVGYVAIRALVLAVQARTAARAARWRT